MEFGIFDHLDRNALPLHRYYEERLRLIEAYDRGGFYCYHLAEHHSTPLGMAPSPSVFLSAAIQRTRRLRFAPLVYLLPFYHPLRLIEEICMLDQMSGGRFEIGLGRGISPIETAYYGLRPEDTPRMFAEGYEIVLAGLSADRLTFEGEFYRFRDVPLELRPYQRPHPPLWYGVHTPESAERAARAGYHVVSLDGTAQARETAERYREVRARLAPDAPATKAGMCRFIVVADSDAEALRLARRAYPAWYDNFIYLFRLHGVPPTLGARPTTFDEAAVDGRGVAGTPATVAQILREQLAGSGFNYLVGQFAFGDLSPEECARSVELFAREVIPALRAEPSLAAS